MRIKQIKDIKQKRGDGTIWKISDAEKNGIGRIIKNLHQRINNKTKEQQRERSNIDENIDEKRQNCLKIEKQNVGGNGKRTRKKII